MPSSVRTAKRPPIRMGIASIHTWLKSKADQQDVGRSQRVACCPIALALQEHGAQDVGVSRNEISYDWDGFYVSYRPSRDVARFIAGVDEIGYNCPVPRDYALSLAERILED